MTRATDSPFVEAGSPQTPDTGEFALRPLRIQKRADKSEKSVKAEKPEKQEKQEMPPVAKRKLSSGASDFVCRPMRLALVSSPSRLRGWSLDKESSGPGEIKPCPPSPGQRSGKGHSRSQSQNSGLNVIEKVASADVAHHRKSDFLHTPPAMSRAASTENPSLVPSRQPSVKIKNLPILSSPKRSFTNTVSLQVDDTIFAVCLVDFHHVRGPEVQWWKSNYHTELGEAGLFKNLPFQALPDGLHLFEETFSNFNLVYDFSTRLSLDNLADIEAFKGNPNHLETLFGCSCVRQVKTADLSETELERNKEITRSIVQKAVVVIARKQPVFTKIKEKLAIITHSFFQQDSFGNFELLESLFDNLNDVFRLQDEAEAPKKPVAVDPKSVLEPANYEAQEEFFVNLNLQNFLSRFKNDFLVIFKALLLEKKVLVYSNDNLELLTQFQNNMIALVPNLINSLELAGCPLSDYTEKHSPLEKPTSLKTNDRMSMLRFFGLPLQIFNTKGSFWNPYLPLPQMDALRARACMVGCSNLLIVNQLANFGVDIVVNLDTWSVNYPNGRPEELRLSTLDKKFVSVLLAASASRDAYAGSDDHIRHQFEDYVRSLLATTRFQQYTHRFGLPPPGFNPQADRKLGNLKNFNADFFGKWQQTKNFEIWDATSDEFIFNFHTPAHIAADMAEPGAGLNLGGFLASFKKAPPPTTTLGDKATQYFSHAQPPRKYIASEEKTGEAAISDTPQATKGEAAKGEAAKGAWWGFKKA